MIRCLVEANVTTSQITYPLMRGWLNPPDWMSLHDRISLEDVTSEPSCALIDAIDAAKLAETHVILTDLAAVSQHIGSIVMHTSERPDDVLHAEVQLGDVSSTAEAVARATVHHFYGIDVVDWVRTSSSTGVTVVEGADALIEPSEEVYLEDLIRAWFIMTSLALPTHLFVVPRAMIENEPDAVRKLISTLQRSVDVAEERRRELRRNLSSDYGIERDLLIDFQSDQRLRLTKSARKGWLDLTRRVAHQMGLPKDVRPEIASI
jgi:hypothetical protein